MRTVGRIQFLLQSSELRWCKCNGRLTFARFGPSYVVGVHSFACLCHFHAKILNIQCFVVVVVVVRGGGGDIPRVRLFFLEG